MKTLPTYTAHALSYESVPQLAARDLSYIETPQKFTPYVEYTPDTEGINEALQKRGAFEIDRRALVEVLSKQYQEIDHPTDGLAHLLLPHCYTVTAAHQPVLLGGPLYTVYKIASIIHLSRRLSKVRSTPVLPVFVIGSEDHDFEEINKVQLFSQSHRWHTSQGIGPVGRLQTDELLDVLEEVIYPILGSSQYAPELRAIIRDSFLPGRPYGRAFQSFILRLFEDTELIVLDMDDRTLKQRFIPILREELLEAPTASLTRSQQDRLHRDMGWAPQIFPRPINLFYQGDGMRKRIEKSGVDEWMVVGTPLRFDRQALLSTLEDHPERFSPNVALRPVYQSALLPDIAFIGGPSEVAYWMEIQRVFSHFNVHFPVLLRRPSALWVYPSEYDTLRSYGEVHPADFFRDIQYWESKALEHAHVSPVPDKTAEEYLHSAYSTLLEYAEREGLSLESSLRAAEKKSLNLLHQSKAKLTRALKQRHDRSIRKIHKAHQQLFPIGNLQERVHPFIPAYLQLGSNFIQLLIEHLDPLDRQFKLFTPK